MLKTTVKEISVVSGMNCDRCGNDVCDDLDLQEALHIDTVGGYNSIFGDENRIQCDLCQDCVKEVLGPFLRISPRTQADAQRKPVAGCK